MNPKPWEDLVRLRRLQEQTARGRLRRLREAAEEQRRRAEEARRDLEAYRSERQRRTELLYKTVLGRRLPPGDHCRAYQAIAGLREGEERQRLRCEEREALWRQAVVAAERARVAWLEAQREWEAVREYGERLREEDGIEALRREESESEEAGQAAAGRGSAASPVEEAWGGESTP